jgi:UDP-N-acetylglucosamine--N-acetylmuramyl-(pentapeptide) pyrophosphoryl-undecaprenol N-acetylglucosamine transferase
VARVKRIVCYAVNGAGLGHVTRLVAVGKWLRRYTTLLEGRQPEIIFLTSSEATEVLDRAGFMAFKVPSKTVVRRAGVDVASYKRLARHFIWQTLGVFEPDLLVVDTFPSGSFDELFQVLDGPMKTGLIHRRVKPEYEARPVFAAARDLYDVVVVPHRQTSGVGIACGEVLQVDREELPAPSLARARLGVSADEDLVYVSAGGGGDPGAEQQLRGLVEALSRRPNTHLLVGAGPLYRGARLHGPNLTWFSGPGVVELLPACDAAVSAAGYNTFHELLYLQIPTAFFAQPKVADDQSERIDRAAEAGACIRLSDLAGASLAVDTLLRDRAVAEACGRYLPNNGAAACARALLSPLYDRDRLAWAGELLDARLAAQIDRSSDREDLLGRWLPRLAPPGSVRSLGSRDAFSALLSELSESAATEVRLALAGSSERGALDRLRDQLGWLIESGVSLALLEAAFKKYPLAQETGTRADWLDVLLATVTGLAKRDARVQQAWRVFPRLVDANAAAAVDAFDVWLARPREADVDLQATLQVLKLRHRRVTLGLLEESS